MVGERLSPRTSVAVLAFTGAGSGQAEVPLLLTCTVSTGACDTPGEELPMEIGRWQLPIGTHFGE